MVAHLVVPGHWVMHRLAKMSEDSLHANILSDNVDDALHGTSSHNWAAGIQSRYAGLGLASPFQGGRLQSIDVRGFQRAMLAREGPVWQGLDISPIFSLHCALSLCQALHVLALVCQA